MEIRALYSVAMLARYARVSRQKLHRLLRRCGVVLLRDGRSVSVPLSEIRRKIPPLWESICDAQDAHDEAKTRRKSASTHPSGPSRPSRPRSP
jgi:hypothetical protein